MRVDLDKRKCQGHNRCVAMAPEVYGTDNDGFAMILMDPVPEELRERCRRGARACPERALTIVEE